MKLEETDKTLSPEIAQEAMKFLDAIEASFRASTYVKVFRIIFIWSQRKDKILSGQETFEDQNIT